MRQASRWTGALRVAAALACAAAPACSASEDVDAAPVPSGEAHPRLLCTADQRDRIRGRLDEPRFAGAWERVRATAAATPVEVPPGTWKLRSWQTNAQIAQANALLAWSLDDAAAAAKAKALLLGFAENFEDDREGDIDIGLPDVLVPFVNTWDLLLATPWIAADEARAGRDHVTTVTRKFVERYLDSGFYRTTSFVVTQNNHPLRAASALGYVALAFPDDPDAGRWLDWSTDQIDYLLGPKGHYVQRDGAVSEGPFYYGFAFAAVMPLLIALDANDPPGAVHRHTCITRNDADPWSDHGCVEGEPFTLQNPLRDPTFLATMDWSVSLRRPSGVRAALDDTRVAILAGGALATSFGGGEHLVWDWENNAVLPSATDKFGDLAPWYLAWVADVAGAPPPWRNRFFPDGGQATFRSGWGEDDLWLALVADHGAARKSLHNHADGTSFALSAYGEDLLVDTGYYKPDASQNPLTTDAPSHNVVLVDGAGAPKRGLLNDWGDTDAFLENLTDGESFAWADARTDYEQAEIRRGVAFVRRRYFVVADRIRSRVAAPRTFQWRAHLWAGHEAGGAYDVAGDRVTVDRARAGLTLVAGTTAGAPSFVEPPFVALRPPHVHDLGEKGNHAVVDATIEAGSPSFLVVLAPYAEGAAGERGPLAITRLDAGAGGAAFLVEGTSGGAAFRDVAWLREPGAAGELALPGGRALATDAEVVVVSDAGDRALLVGGTRLSLDGAPLVASNAAPVAVVGP